MKREKGRRDVGWNLRHVKKKWNCCISATIQYNNVNTFNPFILSLTHTEQTNRSNTLTFSLCLLHLLAHLLSFSLLSCRGSDTFNDRHSSVRSSSVGGVFGQSFVVLFGMFVLELNYKNNKIVTNQQKQVSEVFNRC